MDNRYGSDVIVNTLQQLGIEFASMNPGASWRGLQASLVDAGSPELIMCLHENVAVGLANGYGKATGKPMAAILHNLVGLQTGLMSIFSTWINQTPALVLGGSGPADHARKRPWIDWVHSARPQSLIARDYVKWDDEPLSVEAVPASLRRAYKLSMMAPQGPTYVNFDALLQEEELNGRRIDIPTGQVDIPLTSAPTPDLERIAEALLDAERPVIIADYTGKTEEGFRALSVLAESLSAPVVDCGVRHNFPNNHPLDQAFRRTEMLRDADVVLCLDARDVVWAISTTSHKDHGLKLGIASNTKVINISLTDQLHRGFISREAHYEADISVSADSRVVLPMLAELVAEKRARVRQRADWIQSNATAHRELVKNFVADGCAGEHISEPYLMKTMWEIARESPWLIAFGGSGRNYRSLRSTWELVDWNCHLGPSGGGGLGYGPAASVGAALAHRDDDTLVINFQPDGDSLYTFQAMWTAAHHRIPLLTIMLNNRTYGQDRMHQTLITEARGGDLTNVSIGIDLEDPTVDFVALAKGFGVEGFGPVEERSQLKPVLERAAHIVRTERRPVLVDVVLPR